METTRRSVNRATMAVTGGVAALVVLAVVAVAVGSKPADLDPASPAGVVQSYVAALLDRDVDTADSLLTSNARFGCDRYYTVPTGIRVGLLSTDVYGDRAVVRVQITTSSGDPFGDGWSNEDQFGLVLDDAGAWKINTAPWQLAWCPR